MAVPSLRGFLSRASRAVKGNKACTIVVGNEASDVDSIISSLCTAYIKDQQSSEQSRQFVPVIAVPRSILKLRSEAQILLRFCGLELEDLICLEEIDVKSLSCMGNLVSFILTDHNHCSRSISTLLPGGIPEAESKVEMILDHHKDMGAHSHLIAPLVRRIAFDAAMNKASAGSACTLVAEYLQELVGVGTPRDDAALQYLEMRVQHTTDRDSCFKALIDAKFNQDFWKGLSTAECLSIDYKQFPQKHGHEVGIAAVLLPLESHGAPFF
eukprot:GSChrysophyteH1.ASY1.ANO1.1575.1 assembled CDS